MRALLVCVVLASPSLVWAQCTNASFALPGDQPCASEVTDITSRDWFSTLTTVTPNEDQARAALGELVEAATSDSRLDVSWRAWLRTRMARMHAEGPAAMENSEPYDECSCAFFQGSAGDERMCIRLEGEPEGDTCAPNEVVAEPAIAARYWAYARAAVAGRRALSADARRTQHIALRRAVSRWRNLLSKGYAQFPWELCINGRGHPPLDQPYGTRDLNPRRHQWVLLHPTVGVGFQGFGKNADPQSQGVAVLGIEAFGFLYYTKSFSHYFGLAALVAVDNLDFGDPRVGFTLHLTRFVSLGMAFAVAGDAQGDGTLLMSIDLFGFVQRGVAWTSSAELTEPSIPEGVER